MNKRQNSTEFTWSYFIIIIFFGMLFVTLDFTMDFLQSSGSSGSLFFLGPNQDKILKSIISMCVFVLFGSHVRYSMNRQRELENSQRQYAEALLKSDTKNKDILESIDEAYYEATLDGKLLSWNQSLIKLLGSTEEELKHKDFKLFVTNYKNKGIVEASQKALDTGKAVTSLELELERKDGSIRSIDFSIGLTKNSVGDSIGFRGVVRDITAKKKVESLRHAKKVAEMANKTKSEFLANMSHEIRTPLNGVVGMLNLMEETKLNLEQKDYLETAFISAESLLDVINDILDFSKIEAGKLDLEKRSFNLENEIYRLITIFAPKANEKKLELIVRYDPKAPRFVIGDQIRIRQILNNLINNALKFTKKGSITINNRCIRTNNKEATFEISVEDTGIGIAEEKQPTIFDNFTQADTTTTRKFGGTGLGLSICKQLVKLMNGKIELDSIPDKGSTFKFTISLPIDKKGKTDKKNSSNIIDTSALLKEYIIVVDDNMTNRKIFSEYLSRWKIRHTVFSKAMEAYEDMESAFKRQDPYTLLISDHLMPEMDGEELGRKVKSNEDLKHTIMVMVSSSSGQSSMENFEQIGFAGYLHKPVNMSDLFNLLQTVITKEKGPIIQSRAFTSQLKIEEHSVAKIKGAEDKYLLIVEDNKINQKANAAILKKLGFSNIAIADNGQYAVEMISNNSYDIVLMDVQMPVMDGYEATKAVRKMEIEKQQTRVPIIAQTANAMKGDKDKCIKAGMDDYISKPIDKKELIKVLNRWIGSNKNEESPEPCEIKPEPCDIKIEENEIINDSILVFNYKVALARYSNDHEILMEIVHTFLEECPEGLEAIKEGITTNDNSVIAKAAHAIKGSASYVNADRLREIACTFETIAKSGDLTNSEVMIDTMIKEFLLFKKTIKMLHSEDVKN